MSKPAHSIVEQVRRLLNVDDKWSIPINRGFRWWGGPVGQSITASPTGDSVEVRTDIFDDFDLDTIDPSFLESMMRQVRMHGLVRDSDRLQWLTRFYIDEDSLSWAPRLLATTAAIQLVEASVMSTSFADELGVKLAVSSHPQSGPRESIAEIVRITFDRVISAGQGESAFRGAEMNAAFACLAAMQNLVARRDEKEITAGLPFGLLQINSTAKHPVYGSGVLLLLSVARSSWRHPFHGQS